MTPQTSVQGHPASVDAYIRHGWKLVPIPHGTKGPNTKGWNKPENTLGSSAQLPTTHGIGLAHAYSGTMALDVDHWDRAVQELAQQGIDLLELYTASNAVTIVSGKAGHGKLLYQMPFGLTLPSKKLIDSDDHGGKYNYLDFRCATANGLTVQDVLPPSTHPETLQPYSWGGTGHWTRLPMIPPQLLAYWQSLVDADQQRTISDGSGVDSSWDDLRQALEFVSPDLNRDDWVNIGMALHWAGIQTNQPDAGFHLWDEWSSKSPTKYRGQRDLTNCWRSFSPDGGVTLGTLFKIAKDNGWRRPVPSADELFAQVQPSGTTGEGSGPVDLLTGMRVPAPNPDLELWPAVLATRAKEVAEGVGCDPLVPLFSGLAVASGVADSRIRLELVPGFTVPPILWLMTIGNPADKKSPGSRPFMGVMRELEKEDRPRHRQALLEWEAQEAVYAAAHKAFLEHYANAEAQMDNDVAPTVPDLPAKPAPVKITVEDITSQKLVRHAAERPRGLLCWLDEMNGWARKITDPRSGDDRSTWTKSYEGVPYEYDRVGAGSIWCDNFAVSVFGNIQPKVYRKHLQHLTEDGMLQRFIPAILRPQYTGMGNPVPEAFSSKPQWDQTIRTIYALPERVYHLSEDAYKVFREFQHWYEATKQDERLLRTGDDTQDDYMTAFGKVEGQCGRLALVFHMIEAPLAPTISGELMGRVVAIVKDYVIPALRHALGEIGGLIEDSLDAWMVNHILSHSSITQTLTLREIKHSARRRLAKMGSMPISQKDNIIIDAMALLEKCNWVALVDSDPRRSHYLWQINPALSETFKDQREAILKAKQRMLDQIVNTSARPATKRTLVPGYDPGTMDAQAVD